MRKLFVEVGNLDKKCYDELGLNEDILMEHAAISLEQFIRKKFKKNSKILIVCGPGNNGADGIALARLLYGDFELELLLPYGTKSDMAKIQLDRVKKIDFIKKSNNFKITTSYLPSAMNYALIVDCLFGSGLNKDLKFDTIELIEKLNEIKSFKLSCDIPTGINLDGVPSPIAFKADVTVTMGADKLSIYSDLTKDYVGKIKIANLGVARKIYEDNTNYFLLQKKDLKLPFRKNKNSNKGSYGHLNIIVGEKKGASILAGLAAFNFGVGLVSLISKDRFDFPPILMQSNTLSKNVSAIAVGMGLGDKFDEKFLLNNIPKVVDADLFYNDFILKLLKQNEIVLTPHPKEFSSLLGLTGITKVSVDEVQKNRFRLAKLFSKTYPNVVLVLKGANIIIAHNENLYINKFGKNNLSKGGSGDILAGLIASLLAQNYTPLESAINGSLAFSLVSKKYKKNNYSLTPDDLIKGVKKLKTKL